MESINSNIETASTSPIIGIYHPSSHPGWYYIGEWSLNNRGKLHFKGLFARGGYNGMSSRGFSFLPVSYEMSNDLKLENIKKIDWYKYKYIKKELNNLFTHLIKWINIIPENTESLLFESDESDTLKSPGIIYNEGTIYLSKELRWLYNGQIEGSYYEAEHISFYKASRQQSSYLKENKDYEEFPAVNDFYGFTTLEFVLLYNSSTVKRLSLESYDLLHNAFENGMHWIYRSIQAANQEIYLM